MVPLYKISMQMNIVVMEQTTTKMIRHYKVISRNLYFSIIVLLVTMCHSHTEWSPYIELADEHCRHGASNHKNY